MFVHPPPQPPNSYFTHTSSLHTEHTTTTLALKIGTGGAEWSNMDLTPGDTGKPDLISMLL